MSEAADKLSIDEIVKSVLCGRCMSILVVERLNSEFGLVAHCNDCGRYSHIEPAIYYGGCKEILIHE
jgi:hypothetical protein